MMKQKVKKFTNNYGKISQQVKRNLIKKYKKFLIYHKTRLN